MGLFVNKICNSNCVWGGQGSPQRSAPEFGSTRTLGSSMNRRAIAPAASGRTLAGSPFSGAPFWIALFACVALSSLSSPFLRAESAGSMFKHGEAAEAREDYDTAFDLYQKALAKAPNDLTFKTALYRVRVSASGMHMSKGRQLLQGGDDQGALVEFLHASEIDPSNEAAQQEVAKLRKRHGEMTTQGESSLAEDAGKQQELDSMGSPVILKPLSNDPLTLHYTEDAKVIYQAIGKAAGINVLFDPD